MKAFIERAAWLYATVGGVGMLRPAPGTWGSIPGFLMAWWATHSGWPMGWVALATVIALCLAIPAATITARKMQKKDPGSIVADEAFAVPVGVWPLMASGITDWRWWSCAFVLYRILDILKPWPARQLERLPEGTGIVVDDVASAAWCGLLVWLALRWWG